MPANTDDPRVTDAGASREQPVPLPGGTVTFLFTDIEGSTRRWEHSPAAMRAAVDRHFALLRAAIAAHGGHIFRTEGDGLCAAFATAPPALAAALAAQVALHTKPWPAGDALRVRMALHTGAAEVQDGDYVGACLNRMGRLHKLGHGCQTLLSRTTCDLVREALPAGAGLRDLGEHRLRDLAEPEQVFQLLHPELPADFPPLKSVDVPRHNLPVQLTSFVGRERELADVQQVVSSVRLLTLTGAGGVGKTRLALQVAAALVDQFPDGVWLVDLAPLADPGLVAQTVASVLRVREEPGRPLEATLADTLRPRQLLLLLDNCEHLVAACGQLADALLRVCPEVRLLATSREALGIAGETTWRVPPLALPPPECRPPAGHLAGFEAVRLFLDRARAVRPDFGLTDENAAAVAQVCRRLDGIPLALELAAARVPVLTPEQIAARLDDCFRLLTGGSRTVLPRQQTLRALVDWSYDLLSEWEQALFRRLAAFAGGWTLEAAEAVCAGEIIASDEILELLAHLVSKSLVVADEQGGARRYRLLQTIRQYAAERLRAAGEAAAVRGRHRDWFLAQAEQAEAALWGPGQAAWLERLEVEHDNLRAALEWSRAADDGEAMLRLAGALARFWDVRGYLSEGRGWLEAALGAAPTTRTVARARALSRAGYLAVVQGDLAAARARLEEGLVLGRDLGDEDSIGATLLVMGLVAQAQRDHDRAAGLFEESLSMSRRARHPPGVYTSLYLLASTAQSRGDFQQARALHEESLRLKREQGDAWSIAVSLFSLGTLARMQDDHARAWALYRESLALREELRDRDGIAACLRGLACLAGRRGEAERAARLFGAAEALWQAVGLVRPRDAGEERLLAETRSRLGEPAFAAAWGAGRAMSLEQAVEYALAGGEPAAAGAGAAVGEMPRPRPPDAAGAGGGSACRAWLHHPPHLQRAGNQPEEWDTRSRSVLGSGASGRPVDPGG